MNQSNDQLILENIYTEDVKQNYLDVYNKKNPRSSSDSDFSPQYEDEPMGTEQEVEGLNKEDLVDLGAVFAIYLGDRAINGFNHHGEETLSKWLSLANKLTSVQDNSELNSMIVEIESEVNAKNKPDDSELKDYGDYGQMRVPKDTVEDAI